MIHWIRGKVLAVDPGEKRIGLAVSDDSGSIANPLVVIKHVSRQTDAERIIQLAEENQVQCILVGQSVNEDNQPTPQGRSAARLAEVIRFHAQIPVILWDESGSTQAARSARLAMGVSRRKRHGHMDDLAATYLLQDYLNGEESP